MNNNNISITSLQKGPPRCLIDIATCYDLSG